MGIRLKLWLQRVKSLFKPRREVDPIPGPWTVAYFGDWGSARDPKRVRNVDTPQLPIEDPAPQDRYPNIYDLLAVLQEAGDLPNEPIERLEVTALASGEATYRFWRVRAEESEGGYLPPGVV